MGTKFIKTLLVIFLFSTWPVNAGSQTTFEPADGREIHTRTGSRLLGTGTTMPSAADHYTKGLGLYDSSSQRDSQSPRSWVNVKNHGAKGDGFTDDTANINIAIAAGAGSVVYFPKGTYLVKQLITPAVNTRIIGDGKGISVLKRNKATNDAYILILGHSGSSVSNLTFDGNRANNQGITGGELVVQGDDVDVDNIEVINSEWLSIQLHGKRTRIRNCTLKGSSSGTTGAQMGIWMATDAVTDTIIEGCTISDYRLGAIFAGGVGKAAAGRIRIINNTFSGNHRQNTGTGGGQVAFGGIGGHIVMANTFIVGDGATSVFTSSIEANAGAIIVGNSFNGGGVHLDGIVLQAGSHYSVSDNQVTGYKAAGLLINEGITDITVTGNNLNGNGVPFADGSTTAEKQIVANLPTLSGDPALRKKWWNLRQGK